MTFREPRSVPLPEVQLGDIIVLPDQRAMTVRGRVDLEAPVGSMAGFIICNELEAMLSTPSTPGGPVNVYVPIDYMPHAREHLSEAAHGVFSYWAPHLPALSGAMGELGFRVFRVRGSLDPVVVVYRGPEVIVFIRATYANPEDLQVLCMDRNPDNEQTVVRHTGIVHAPAYVAPPLPAERRTLYQDVIA